MYRKNTCLVYLAASCSEDVTDPWLCIVKLTSSAPTGIMDRRQPVVVKDLLLPLVTPSDAERHRVQTCTGSQSARSWTRCGVNAQCSCFSCGRRLSGCLSNLVSSLATDEFCDLGKLLDFPESKEISSSLRWECFSLLEIKWVPYKQVRDTAHSCGGPKVPDPGQQIQCLMGILCLVHSVTF